MKKHVCMYDINYNIKRKPIEISVLANVYVK